MLIQVALGFSHVRGFVSQFALSSKFGSVVDRANRGVLYVTYRARFPQESHLVDELAIAKVR